MFAVWQQSLVVFATIGLSQLINSWIENIAGLSEWNMWYLVPAFVSALLWPWIFLVLRFLRRFFNVT
jgi:rod shape-determining protein MreD